MAKAQISLNNYSGILSIFSKGMFEIKKINDDQYFWVLKSANGQVLCYSETYKNKESAKNAIANCMKCAASANVIDKS